MDYIELAKKCGFDVAVKLLPEKLVARKDIRDMCKEDKCGVFGKNWTCPPECGTLEECERKMRQYKNGILLQKVGNLSRVIDVKAYIKIEKEYRESLLKFAAEIKKTHPNALCLGAGACTVCEKCAYPNPCLFPEKALSSMEAYGLFVTQVCRDCNVPYYYGEKTITFMACVLY